MNEKTKLNLIGAGIAFIIVGSLATWGITSYMHGMDAIVKPLPTPTVWPSQPPIPSPIASPAIANADAISGYKFNRIGAFNINAQQVVYQGTEMSIAMLPQDVKVQALKSAISTHEESVAIISGIHEKWNETTGWKNIEDFSSTDATLAARAWVVTLTKLLTSPEMYGQMAEVNVSEDVKKDLNNVAALMKIAHEKRDPKALVYAHRIMHDLDYWVYNTPGSAQNPDKFGAAHAYKNPPKSTVANVEAFISENK
jgi:hypothetical protein